jgi:hypothetical protein
MDRPERKTKRKDQKTDYVFLEIYGTQLDEF